MSHYSRVTTMLKRKSALIKALTKMGFKQHMIECFDEPVNLKGYQGDDRKQKAHLRIKGAGWGYGQNYVGAASNDLGFEKLEDGSYALHVSDYDKDKYGTDWQNRLKQQYGKAVIEEVCEENNLFLEEEYEEAGELYITVQSQF